MYVFPKKVTFCYCLLINCVDMEHFLGLHIVLVVAGALVMGEGKCDLLHI